MSAPFKINFLDHVALRCKNPKVSISWYEKVLGLRKYQLKEWGEYPVFLLAGTSGLAIFPLKNEENYPINSSYDHFAFNVSGNDFIKAKEHLTDLAIDFEFQDHIHFHSIYFKDPDNHTVELTTLISKASDFYYSE